MTSKAPEFSVLRELGKEEEPSSWSRSVLAWDPESGTKVVITRLHKDKILQFYTYREAADKLTPEGRELLVEEAAGKFREEDGRFEERNKRVIGLIHPNISKVINVQAGGPDGAVVVMEYAPGAPISDVTVGMTVEAMVPIFLNMIEAIIFMHQNSILHLNLKSRRVKVLDDYANFSVKLTDFGYAVEFGKFEEHYLPTPSYCAPEVALFQKDRIGETSDLFSLGVIMYQCMARTLPFPRRETAVTPAMLCEVMEREFEPMKPSEQNPHILETPSAWGIQSNVDPSNVKKLEDIVMGLIKKNVDDRPIRTAPELGERISAIFPEACRDKMIASGSITLSVK